MYTPIQLSALRPRSRADLQAAAHAVQANVATLRVAWDRRLPGGQAGLDIRTPPPGPVKQFREMLIPLEIVKSYTVEEVALRLHQVWGEFSAFCWLFCHQDPHTPPAFVSLEPDHAMRCPAHVQEKLAEIQTGLWRMRHEQRVRHDAEARRDPAFQREHEIALMQPVMVYGQDVRSCGDADLLFCACESAGMLASLRWATDDRWTWEGPHIMDVALDVVGMKESD